jgi:WD40 repeat protein
MEKFLNVAMWKTGDDYLKKVLKINNNTIATAGNTKNIEFWDLKNSQLIKTLKNPDDQIFNMLLLSDDYMFVISHGYATIWKGDRIYFKSSLLRWEFDFCFHFDEMLISLGNFGQLKTWTIEYFLHNTNCYDLQIQGSSEKKYKFLTNIQNKFIAIVDCVKGNQLLIIKEIETLKTIKEIKFPVGVCIFSLVFDEHLKNLYLGSEVGVLYVVDCISFKITNSLNLGTFELSSMIMLNRLIVVGDLSNHLFIVDPFLLQIVSKMELSEKESELTFGISDITKISENSFVCVDYSGYCFVLEYFPKFHLLTQVGVKLVDLKFKFK